MRSDADDNHTAFGRIRERIRNAISGEPTDSNDENGVGELIQATSIAVGHRLDNDVYDDRIEFEHGVYILNQWGYGRRFEFEYAIRGPFSGELDDEFLASDRPTDLKTIPQSAVDRLTEVLGRGADYSLAYVTILAMLEGGFKKTDPNTLKTALIIGSDVKDEIREAAKCLLV